MALEGVNPNSGTNGGTGSRETKKVIAHLQAGESIFKVKNRNAETGKLDRVIHYKDFNGDGDITEDELYMVDQYYHNEDGSSTVKRYKDKDGDGYDDTVTTYQYDKNKQKVGESTRVEEDINAVKNRQHMAQEVLNREMKLISQGTFVYSTTSSQSSQQITPVTTSPTTHASNPVNNDDKNDLRRQVNVDDVLQNNDMKFLKESNGKRIYTNDSGDKVTISKSKSGFTVINVQYKDAQSVKMWLDDSGHLVQRSEYSTGIETGVKIEVRENYYKDGSIKRVAYFNGEQAESFYDGTQPSLGVAQYVVKNSPAKIINGHFPTEKELTAAGYQKNDSMMTTNGGVFYENPQTGESIMVEEFGRSIEYRNGNITQRQYYDLDGNVAGGEVSVKGKNGAFEIIKYHTDEETKELITYDHVMHEPVTDPKEMASEGYDAHFDRILEFSETLGGGWLMIDNFTSFRLVETGYDEVISDDGKYKTTATIDADGNMQMVFLKKEGNKFVEVGIAKLTKTNVTSSLRGYDYELHTENKLTGRQVSVSSTNWD
ncbi:hypothetical protein IJ579_03235 [bacterium]|nr:hypothetical protein [bacterium]